MHYVYVLKSIDKQYIYTGGTNDLKKRFKEHNQGEVISTKPYHPFILIYYESCLNKQDAYNREKYLKTRLGKQYLKKRLANWYEEGEKMQVDA